MEAILSVRFTTRNMPTEPNLGLRWRVTVPLAAFAYGLFLQFNPLSATWGLPFLRLSDLFVFVALAAFASVLRRGEFLPVSLAAGVLGSLVLASLLFKTSIQQGDSYMTLMLFASLVLALIMGVISKDVPALVAYFSVGVLVGMGLSILILLLRVSGVNLTSVGLGTPQALRHVFDMSLEKPGGIWVHGNEAGHVYALAGSSALYLSLRYRRPVIYAIYYIMFMVTFAVTLNRGGVIAPTIGFAVAFLVAGKGRVLARLALGALGCVLLSVAIAQLPQFEGLRSALDRRFSSDAHAGQNVSERTETLLGGAAVALRHPFGIGYAERTREVAYESGVASGSSHNGLIALAYQAGLAIALLYIFACFRNLSRLQSFRTLPYLMSAFALPSLMFEELTLNPNFQFAIGLSVTALILPMLRMKMGRANLDWKRAGERAA